MPWVKAIQEILQPADLLYLYHLFVSEIWPFKDHQRDHINFQWKSQNERVHKFYSSALVFAGTVKFFPTFPRGTFIPWQHQMHWCLSKLLENKTVVAILRYWCNNVVHCSVGGWRFSQKCDKGHNLSVCDLQKAWPFTFIWFWVYLWKNMLSFRNFSLEGGGISYSQK